MSFLQNHPFAVRAFFEQSLVLTYAFPKAVLASLVPEPLTLDCFRDEWAFLAVAVVSTKGLRPAFMPPFTGNDFILIGYRIFVRYTNLEGKKRRGLYILHSETNSSRMQALGNIFTHYNYSTVDASMQNAVGKLTVNSPASGLEIVAAKHDQEPPLPALSPFSSWKEARKFAGPMPFTFQVLPNRRLLIVEGKRNNWVPRPLEILQAKVPFLREKGLTSGQLANAFIVEQVPYFWKKGITEKF